MTERPVLRPIAGCAVGRRTEREGMRWGVTTGQGRTRMDPTSPGGPRECLTGDWEGVSGAMLQPSWGVPGEPGGDGVGSRSPSASVDTAG